MPDTKFFNFPDGNSSVADILAASNNGGMNQMWNNPIWANGLKPLGRATEKSANPEAC